MIDRSAIVEMLGASSLFGRLDPSALVACAAAFNEQRFETGQMLFARGDKGGQLLLVAEGRIRLAVSSEIGRELSVRHAVRGELIGELSVLDGSPRSADAIAIAPVCVFGMRRALFLDLAERHPAIYAGAVAFLCERLRKTTDQLEGIALYPVEARLARFLLVGLAGREAPPGKRIPVDMTFSQNELAQLLGASRPKVNGALGALERAGAIRRTEDRIFCDPELLNRLAGPADG